MKKGVAALFVFVSLAVLCTANSSSAKAQSGNPIATVLSDPVVSLGLLVYSAKSKKK